MSNGQSKRTLSRRGALTVISSSVCAAINLSRNGRAAPACAAPLPRIPQVAGNLRTSTPGVFAKPQLETLAALSEVIIPADEHSPGARAAGVDSFIDEIIGASDHATKEFWIAGLSALDKLTQAQWGKAFVDCSPDQQFETVRKISLGEARPTTLEERFFVAVKRATVEGYYNSQVGIHKDLQYQGNEFLPEFEGCPHPSHAAGAKPGSE